jgi:hypothetical protein
MTTLSETLQDCAALLPAPFRAEHARLFVDEHLARLAARLLTFHQEGVPAEQPPPHFAAETTPPLADSWAFFRDAVAAWDAAADKEATAILQKFADALGAAGTKHILLMFGQRLTPASLTDARAIPPTRIELLAAANQLHAPPDHLTVAGRALTKHVHRSPEAFWGPGAVRGSALEKNAAAVKVITGILDNTTWWNVFGHFQHEVVYEARVPTGHGARWGHGGGEFIGFLEPFDEERCPTLTPKESDGPEAGPADQPSS